MPERFSLLGDAPPPRAVRLLALAALVGTAHVVGALATGRPLGLLSGGLLLAAVLAYRRARADRRAAFLELDDAGLRLVGRRGERWRLAWPDVGGIELARTGELRSLFGADRPGVRLVLHGHRFVLRSVPLSSPLFGPLPELDRLLDRLKGRGFALSHAPLEPLWDP